MTTHLYLIRHGESVWNQTGRFQGQSDVPLSETGRAQARALAARMTRVPLKAVYASDLARAQETARILAVAHPGRPPVCLEPRLREIDVGQAAGLTWSQIVARWPEARHSPDDPQRPRFPGGESLQQLAERTMPALAAIAARYPGESVAVVTHGGVIKTVVWQILGTPPAARDAMLFDNCGITCLHWGPERRRIRCMNDTAHLEPSE